MGKGGKHPKNYYKEDDRTWRQASQSHGQGGGGGRNQGWSWWPGTWRSPRSRPDSQDNRGRGSQTTFPAYDADWRRSAEMMEVPTAHPKASTPSASGIVKEVQNAVNAARRLEQRLMKTQKEMLQKGQAWDSWVLEMRATYAKESDRHKAEQARLLSELRDLEAQTQAAYSQVQHVALHRQQESAPPPPLQWETNMEVDEDLTEDQTRQELERILGRSSTAPGPPGLLASTSPPPVTTDAYPVPTETSFSTVPVDTKPALPDPRAPPAAPEAVPAASTLASKLSEKRKAYRTAMGPFGLLRPSTTQLTAEGTNAISRTNPLDSGQAGHLIDDDNEELNAASPGFSNME
eukprot:s1315_g4.t1